MTKKGRQKFWRMKIGQFFGKRSNWENFSRGPQNVSEIGGNLKQGGNASIIAGRLTPLYTSLVILDFRNKSRFCTDQKSTTMQTRHRNYSNINNNNYIWFQSYFKHFAE